MSEKPQDPSAAYPPSADAPPPGGAPYPGAPPPGGAPYPATGAPPPGGAPYPTTGAPPPGGAPYPATGAPPPGGAYPPGAYPPGANPPPYQPQPGPPQPGPPPPGQTVVISTQQQVVKYQDSPTRVKCPNCNNDVMSNISFTSGNLTWIVVGALLLFGLWYGCCLIPLCIDSLKDVDHTCPVCNYHLGKYERLKI